MRIEADGSHSCEINPGLFPTEEVCNGDVSHGVWCEAHDCSAPTAAPTAAPTLAPTAAPTAAPAAAPASTPTAAPTSGVVVGNDPIVKMNGSVYKVGYNPNPNPSPSPSPNPNLQPQTQPQP